MIESSSTDQSQSVKILKNLKIRVLAPGYSKQDLSSTIDSLLHYDGGSYDASAALTSERFQDAQTRWNDELQGMIVLLFTLRINTENKHSEDTNRLKHDKKLKNTKHLAVLCTDHTPLAEILSSLV